MKVSKQLVALGLGTGVLLGGTQALAGSAIIASSDGSTSTFEYNSRMLRINAPDNTGGYALVRDGTLYTVMQEDGRTLVLDAGSMMRSFGNLANITPEELNAEFVSLKKTGKSETVAGIKGDVYELRFVDENGSEQREDMVLSDDPRAREFRDAMFLMIDVASKLTSEQQQSNADEMWERLEKLDSGVLRFGQELTVTSISNERVNADRFELPAEPVDLQGLGNMLGSMSQGADSNTGNTSSGDNEQSGGLMTGIMGALGSQAERQTERQSQRVGSSVEQEIDKEADEQVDNAIGKAFGKLFGR